MYYPSKSLVVVAGMKNRMNAQNQHRRMQFFNFLLICLHLFWNKLFDLNVTHFQDTVILLSHTFRILWSYCHTLSGYCDLTVTHFQDTVILLSHTFRILWSYCQTLSGYCDLTVTHFQDTVILLSHTFRILWSYCHTLSGYCDLCVGGKTFVWLLKHFTKPFTQTPKLHNHFWYY